MTERLWASDGPYALHGKHWDISRKDFVVPERGIGTTLKPYQRPHPPTHSTARSLAATGRPRSQRLAAR